MKILSIRIKNLASLAGEHFIDFESDPLASAGLIAIVGKTGAGKSTILDAMCLALFNKMPRLKDSDGKLKDVDGSELLANAPQTVLRRGTAHGYAELCFVAQDQKRYLARWEIKRARENPTGKLQAIQRSLTCLSDGIVVADKIKAVDEQIKRITQLSFEQFTRAVLLAQSEVTAFLKARDSERGELLEYLTNSSIFGKIGELAFRKTADIAKQRKQLEELIGHIEVLSEEDLALLNRELASSNQALQQHEAQKQQLAQQQQWYQQQQKLDAAIAEKQLQHDAQLQQQQRLVPEKVRLEQLEQFASIRPVVFQQQQQQAAQQLLAPQRQQAQHSFDQLAQQFELEKQHYQQAEQALTQIQAFQQQHALAIKQVRQCVEKRDFIKEPYTKTKTLLSQLEQQQQPLEQQQQALNTQLQQQQQQQIELQQHLQQSAGFSSLDQGLAAHLQQLKQFIHQYQPIEQQFGHLDAAKQQLTQKQAELTQSQQQYGNLEQIETKLAVHRTQREQKLAQCSQFERLEQIVERDLEQQQQLTQLASQVVPLQQQVKQLQLDTQQAEQQYQTAKAERSQLQQMLQQQQLLHSENIEQLRAQLVQGQACIVCGSSEHPYRQADSELSHTLFALQQQQQQQAESHEQTALRHWQQQQQQLNQCQSKLEQLSQQQQMANSQQQQLKLKLKQQLEADKLQLDLQQTAEALFANIQQEKAACQQQVVQLEHAIQQLLPVMKQQQQDSQQLQQLQHSIANATQLLSQVEHIFACVSPEQQAKPNQAMTTLAQQILQSLSQRMQQLEQQHSLQKQIEQQQQQLDLVIADQKNLAAQHASTQQRLDDMELQGKQNQNIATQLILEMTGETEVKFTDWLTRQDLQLQQAQTADRQARQAFEQIRQQFEQQKSEVEQLNTQWQQHEQHLAQYTTDIRAWLKQQPSFDLTLLTELIKVSPAQEQQIRLKLQQAERLLNESAAALNTMQAQLTEHLLQQPELALAELLEQIALNLSQLNQQLEQRDQVKLKLELHQLNLQKQYQFAEQIQAVQQQEHRWSKISGLMGDANGKRFRDSAQQYHLDILIEYANQQLALLSQRYTLQRLDNSLSLAIIDHDMDGETRSVASLSGGESFLTALALSLAIANMASGSMKIESLFIDEGFGTLDAGSLHLVMNALDQLQGQGRKVVLISHISDMHERIPVQIQVNPRGAGASSIEVVG